ncbi:MAG: selenide, water dikinase SelD [Actinomycetota bacterium]|nr:selenide, water dikinase SelD [Actinomycetota bacterium]
MDTEVRLTSYSHGGGCACKLGTLELAEVLGHVRTESTDPAVLVGLAEPDDAAVYRVAPDVAIVQTVDFFTPIVDDPYAWGRIAAANALSDVYAMGARPVTALNLVAWPRSLDFALLGRVLNGGSDVCSEAGVSIVGGHSVDDPEPKYGLSVTGTVHPDRIVAKYGAPVGCDLILTKPLGMGIVASGIKAGKTSEATAAEATRIMATLNRDASEAMIEVGVAAATDVTGFGLIGHLIGMLGAGVGAELHFGSIPVLLEAVELAASGVLPGGSQRNMEAMGVSVTSDGLDDARRALLFDAQTSGGLLMAVPHERTQVLLDALLARNVTEASKIGKLVPGNRTITVDSSSTS